MSTIVCFLPVTLWRLLIPLLRIGGPQSRTHKSLLNMIDRQVKANKEKRTAEAKDKAADQKSRTRGDDLRVRLDLPPSPLLRGHNHFPGKKSVPCQFRFFRGKLTIVTKRTPEVACASLFDTTLPRYVLISSDRAIPPLLQGVFLQRSPLWPELWRRQPDVAMHLRASWQVTFGHLGIPYS